MTIDNRNKYISKKKKKGILAIKVTYLNQIFQQYQIFEKEKYLDIFS